MKPISSWVRVRPIGSHGHTAGEKVGKELGPFSENAVTIVHNDMQGKKEDFKYMNKVFPVDCTQKEVAREVLADPSENSESGIPPES